MTAKKPKVDVTRYPAEVFWSDEDEGYVAIAPDLPGSSAWGSTEAEALTELRQAIGAWIGAAQAAGNVVPAPSKPKTPDQFSGNYALRMPRDLHAELSRAADAQGVSMNQYLVYLLTKRNTAETTAQAIGQSKIFAYYAAALAWVGESRNTGGSLGLPIIYSSESGKTHTLLLAKAKDRAHA